MNVLALALLLLIAANTCRAFGWFSADDDDPTEQPLRTPQQRVCLCMIMANESRVIERTLASVRPLVHGWYITDTGSKDDSMELVRRFWAKHPSVPGLLGEDVWTDHFATNRNAAQARVPRECDYILWSDADDLWIVPEHYTMPPLTESGYHIATRSGTITYPRPFLLRNDGAWKWHGQRHEVPMHRDGHRVSETLPEVINQPMQDSARGRDPKKFHKDAALLHKEYKLDPSPRNAFYLGNSWNDAGDAERAIKWYAISVARGWWAEERGVAQYKRARLMQNAMPKYTLSEVAEAYSYAYALNPSRIEPLLRLSSLYRGNQRYAEAYIVATLGVQRLAVTPRADAPVPAEDGNPRLFVENWIYEYGMEMELAATAYYVGEYRQCAQISARQVQLPQLSGGVGDGASAYRNKRECERLHTQQELDATAAERAKMSKLLAWV